MIPEFAVTWLDVKPNLLSGMLPVYLIERPLLHDQPKAWGGPSEVARVGRFFVPQLDAWQKDPVWTFTQTGQWVRIPVHAYRTPSRSLATIWGAGLQVGMSLLDSFHQRCQNATEIEQVTLILGDDCIDLAKEGQDGFRCFVGIAIRVKD